MWVIIRRTHTHLEKETIRNREKEGDGRQLEKETKSSLKFIQNWVLTCIILNIYRVICAFAYLNNIMGTMYFFF